MNRDKLEEISYVNAILSAQKRILSQNSKSILLGINVTSPSAIFGSVRGLHQTFGPQRVIETPASENSMTGIALGLSTSGHLPILVHQRMDFAILSFDMLINQVAKWQYMYGEKLKAPMIIRMIVGRGWGQGPQHSQSLHSVFMHIPGFRVYMPTTSQDVYSALLEASESDSPSIFFEHRWLYDTVGTLDSKKNFLQAKTNTILTNTKSLVTVITISFSSIEVIRAARILEEEEVHVDIFELIRLDSLDLEEIIQSIKNTKRLLIVDIGHSFAGAASAVLSELVTRGIYLTESPIILGLPQHPTPTAPSLAKDFYPRSIDVLNCIKKLLSLSINFSDPDQGEHLDVPGNRFIGYY